MAVIVLDEGVQAAIAEAVARARANVVRWDQLRGNITENQETSTLMLADRQPDHKRPPSYPVQLGPRVVAAISFEEQPAGLCRHLSISQGQEGKVLDMVTVAMVMSHFGFKRSPGHYGRVWVEEYKPNHFAVNVVELETPREEHGTKQ